MQFDKPEHKKVIQELIAHATFPGSMLELAVELKHAVDDADITATGPNPVSDAGAM